MSAADLRFTNPRGFITFFRSSGLHAARELASGQFRMNSGKTFSTCFREVQFSIMQDTRIIHSSGHRDS
jgi:hypothetical protein